MALGDFGGGLLAGIQGVQQMSQQRRQNQQTDRRLDQGDRQLDIAQAQLEIAQANEGDRRDTRTANQIYQTYQTYGFLTDDRMGLDKQKFIDALQSDNEATAYAARQFIKDAARTSGLLPAGTKDVKIVQGPNGGYALQTVNADGSPGMVTVDGSSEPDSEVAQFPTLSSLVNNLNHTYMTKVLPMQDRFDPNTARNYIDYSDAVLDEINVVNQLPEPVQRGVIGGMANLDDQPEEQQAFVDQVKQDTLGEEPETPPEPEEDNSDRIETLRSGIERLTNRRARLKEGSPLIEKIDLEVARLREELEGLQAPSPEFENPQLEEKAKVVEEKTPEQIQESVESGETVLEDAEIVAVAQDLEREGVRDVSDIQKLSRRKQAVAIAAILASEKDPGVRSAKAKELSNVLETGRLSTSAKDERTMDQTDAQIATGQANVRLRAEEFVRNLRNDRRQARKDAEGREDAATGKTVDWIGDTTKIFTGESGNETPNGYKAKQFASLVLPELRNAATSSKVPGEAAKYNQAIDAGLSMMIAGLAAEEEGGFFETLKDAFGRDDVENNFTTGDFSLSRVRMKTVDGTPNGKPEMFYYTDAQGAPLSEGVTAKALQELDSNAYNLIVKRVRRNQAKQRAAGG